MNSDQPADENTCRSAPAASNIAAPRFRYRLLQLAGSLTALVTPFAATGVVDREAFGRLVELQIASGTQGLIVAGSTGEAVALDDHEYAGLIADAVRIAAGRVPVLAGSGLSATAATIAQTRRAAAAGAQAALVVTPPYVRPTQAGLVAHYRAVAAEGGLAVVLYNVPGRTGVDLLPETVAELVAVPGIIGIKEARAGDDRMRALLALRVPGFAVLSGDDGTAGAAFALGADGVISVASNVAPGLMRALWNARGALADAGQQALLDDLCEFLGVEPNPVPVKALLAELGRLADHLRLPLLPLSAPHRPALAALAPRIRSLESSLVARAV